MNNRDNSKLQYIISTLAIIISTFTAWYTYLNIEKENPTIHYSVKQYEGQSAIGFFLYRLDIFNSGRAPCFNAKIIADYRFYNFFTLPEFAYNIESQNYSFLKEMNPLLGHSITDNPKYSEYWLYYILPKEIKTVYFVIRTDSVRKDENLNITFICDNHNKIVIYLPHKCPYGCVYLNNLTMNNY